MSTLVSYAWEVIVMSSNFFFCLGISASEKDCEADAAFLDKLVEEALSKEVVRRSRKERWRGMSFVACTTLPIPDQTYRIPLVYR